MQLHYHATLYCPVWEDILNDLNTETVGVMNIASVEGIASGETVPG